MRPHEVEALARERLGAEIQAVTLLRATGGRADGLRVWAVLAEHGAFWLVEGPAGPELLRPIEGGWHGVARAVDRYRALHPGAGLPAPAARRAAARAAYACRACGAEVAPGRWSARAERGLCRRCEHASRERRRYREDPAYRARERARGRARRRGRVPR